MTKGKRRPRAVQSLHGEKPAPPVDLPEDVPLKPPRGMSRRARTVWRHVLESAPTGVLHAADRDVIRAYCELVVAVDDLTAEIDAGQLDAVERGRRLRERRSSVLLLVRLARELGCTPSARQSMDVDAAEARPPGLDPARLLN